MLTLTLIVGGFLVVTGLVIVLARGCTARWERSRRSPVAARPAGPARRTSSARAAVGTAGAAARRVVAVVRGRLTGFPRGTVLARRVREDAEPGASRGRPIRRLAGALRSRPLAGLREGWWTRARSPAPPVDGDEADTPLVTESPAGTGLRRRGAAGAARRNLLRRPTDGAPRRVLALLHRHGDPRGTRLRRKSRDGTPGPRS